jgi:hypothetical protein
VQYKSLHLTIRGRTFKGIIPLAAAFEIDHQDSIKTKIDTIEPILPL